MASPSVMFLREFVCLFELDVGLFLGDFGDALTILLAFGFRSDDGVFDPAWRVCGAMLLGNWWLIITVKMRMRGMLVQQFDYMSFTENNYFWKFTASETDLSTYKCLNCFRMMWKWCREVTIALSSPETLMLGTRWLKGILYFSLKSSILLSSGILVSGEAKRQQGYIEGNNASSRFAQQLG